MEHISIHLPGLSYVSCSVVFDSLQPHGLQPAGLFCPWNSPGKNTAVGSHSLLQRIFLTQGSNLGLPHCRQILYCLSHQGSPQAKAIRNSRVRRSSLWCSVQVSSSVSSANVRKCQYRTGLCDSIGSSRMPNNSAWRLPWLVWWLRLHLPIQGVQVPSLVRELRVHMPECQKPRT